MRVPRLSIGVPVFNGEAYLRRALDSILLQDYRDYEVIISDNASTDGTEAIAREYSARDPRFRYFRNRRNIGAVPNFNRTFELSRGEFFKWLSHDDECYPSMFGRCVDVLSNAPPHVVLVYPQCEAIDENSVSHGPVYEHVESRAPLPHQRLARVLFKVDSVISLCGVIRAKYLRQTRMRGSFIKEDRVLLAELAMLGEIWEIPEVLWKLRFHDRNAHRLNRTVQHYMTWISPANAARRFLMPPSVRLFREYLRGVRAIELSASDKLACYATVPFVHCLIPFRNFAGRQRARLSRLRPAFGGR
jgi:glycosyltransferase involved in cell wall biosynthesis